MIDNRKDEHFQGVRFKLHLLCSCIQLICTLMILALQIMLTVTKTCAFRIGIGFWSFPFIIVSPISIWIFLWKQNLIYSSIAFIIQICSNLFATNIIIISFLVLIQRIDVLCLSYDDNYSLPVNLSLIGIALILKVFLYSEMILLGLFRRYNQKLLDSLALNDFIKVNLLKIDLNEYENIDQWSSTA